MTDDELVPQHSPDCDCEPSNEDMFNEAYNILRNGMEDLLSLVLGRQLGVAEWVLVAVPTVVTEEGNSIPVEPRIITERFMADWKTRGLLRDALDGMARDDTLDKFIMVLDEDSSGLEDE